ncbi:MAG: hypothetical protein KGI04_02880 [Candidatus Micrarchaeota archaeon]|nr:hypothetical protein [Candidatus Micrarchaeota archaeon]
MGVQQQAERQSNAVLELERQLRVTHSRVHNAITSFLFPKRMTENELKTELVSRYREIAERQETEAAMNIVNELSLRDIEKAHPSIRDLDIPWEIRDHLKPTVVRLSPNQNMPEGLRIVFYEPTEENKEAALQLMKFLAHAI